MEEILGLINQRINELSEEIKEYFSILKGIAPVALKVVNKRGEYNVDRLIDFVNQPATLERCLKTVPIVEISDPQKLIKVIQSHKEYLFITRQRNEQYKKHFGLGYDDGNQLIKNGVLASKSPALRLAYVDILERDKKIDELEQFTLEILGCFCYGVVTNYNLFKKAKEEDYHKLKTLKHALENILQSKLVLPHEYAALIELIDTNVSDEEKRSYLFSKLKEYVKSVDAKKESSKETTDRKSLEAKNFNQPVTYQDDESYVKDSEDKDSLCFNYLMAVRSFDSFSKVHDFLEAVKPGCNIEAIVNKMISILGTSNEDALLKEYLTTYLAKVIEEDKPLKGDLREDMIIYYDLLVNKNVILEDLKSRVPSSYYNDVVRALQDIKTKELREHKSSWYDSIKKVRKLRVNDIRVSYKQIDGNKYVILGIFCKKDHKGYEVANVTRKRNNQFSLNEKMLVNTLNNPVLGKDLAFKNDDFEQEIYQLLKQKIK